jgi:glycosyltransferase involved in cell wall biosynthesis
VQLLEDNDARAKMGANCRAIALEEYSSDLQAKRYLDLYRSILNPIGIATVKC